MGLPPATPAANANLPTSVSPEKQMAVLMAKLIEVLLKIPPADRRRLAREQLETNAPEILKIFDARRPDQLAHTVLYISVQPHSRETRLAAAARLAGWDPILVHMDSPKYNPDHFFSAHAAARDLFQLVLAYWAYPGELTHVFGLNGEAAGLLCKLKNNRLIIDLYDTCAGIKSVSSAAKYMEREAMRLADGMTHRDLRAKYLQKLHRYQLPRHNVFIHDPLPEIKTPPLRKTRNGPIRVVSVGWVGSGDNSILRIAEALCAHGIHLHVYFSHFQRAASPDLAPYVALQNRSPCFHIEEPVFGDAYWERISQYDFGLAWAERFLYNESWESYTEDYTRGCGSSRLTDYIQMNLGIIMSPGLKFQYFWASRFAAVVVPGTMELLRDPVSTLDAAIAAKTAKGHESITIRGVAVRLGKFYQQVSRKDA
jgi:hypothetical protein